MNVCNWSAPFIIFLNIFEKLRNKLIKIVIADVCEYVYSLPISECLHASYSSTFFSKFQIIGSIIPVYIHSIRMKIWFLLYVFSKFNSLYVRHYLYFLLANINTKFYKQKKWTFSYLNISVEFWVHWWGRTSTWYYLLFYIRRCVLCIYSIQSRFN